MISIYLLESQSVTVLVTWCEYGYAVSIYRMS